MLKTVIVVCLSFQVLLASAGISIYKHTCHLFGETDITIGTPKSCCGEEGNGETQLDFNCCSVDHHYFQVDVEGEFSDVELNSPKDLSKSHSTFNAVPPSEATLITPRSNSPPPLYSHKHTYLSKIQVFLI